MLRSACLTLTAALLVAQTPAPAPTPTPVPVQEDRVLASLGDTVLRESGLRAFLKATLAPQQLEQVEREGLEKARKKFLETQLLAAKARRDGVDRTEAYRQRVAAMEVQILVQELMKKEGPALQTRLNVDDAALKHYYEQHAELFKTPDTFSARHILVAQRSGLGSNAKDLTEAELQAKLTKIQEELKSGKKLQDLAKDYSDDPGSRGKGGLYEHITYGSFAPEFEAAVREQEIGKLGAPVKTKFGYHLIQVEKRNPGEIQPFEKVKDQARQRAMQARQEEVFLAFMDGIKKELGYTEGS